jgi:hypothetical protein
MTIQFFSRHVGSKISGMMVQCALKGAANLQGRNHEQALAQFRESPERLAETCKAYEKDFQFPLSNESGRTLWIT